MNLLFVKKMRNTLIAERKILDIYFIPDLSDIILKFLNLYVDNFDEDFIETCIIEGNYLYFNKNNISLTHYMIRNYDYIEDILLMLENSKYLTINHFQNFDNQNCTELSWFCYKKMEAVLAIIIKKSKNYLKIEHFQNKDNTNRTELYWLCKKTSMSHIVISLLQICKEKISLQYFMNETLSNGYTELDWLCLYKNSTIIKLLPALLIDQTESIINTHMWEE